MTQPQLPSSTKRLSTSWTRAYHCRSLGLALVLHTAMLPSGAMTCSSGTKAPRAGAVKLHCSAYAGQRFVFSSITAYAAKCILHPSTTSKLRWVHGAVHLACIVYPEQWPPTIMHACCRLRALSSATSSTSAPSPIVSVKQAQQAPARPVLARTQTQPSRGYATPAAHARPMQAAAGGKPSKEDSRIREVIMAEVLDMRPSVRWEDVAGLNSAKQVGQNADMQHLLHVGRWQPALRHMHACM